MEIDKFKDEIYNSKIQIIQLDSKGKILESENTLIPLSDNDFIRDIHPFFEGIVPLFSNTSEKIHFPCVNLDLGKESIIVDIDVIHQDNKIFVLIFDFTEHYRTSHPLVQEKNEASILKNKLSFEREILIAKEELKNKFLTHLNHEIRNPLNNLLGFMDILAGTKLSYEQKETLNVMNKTGMQLKVLMDDLVDISKIEMGITEIKDIPFSLSQILNNLIKHFQLKHDKKGVALHFEMDKEVPFRLMGDPARVNQILFNLLDNAYKNTKKGKISVRVTLKEKIIANKPVAILFTISDTGEGISKENLPFVFNTYHQLEYSEIKPIGEGLGLKIVKELVSLLNGDIKIQSKEGEGSTYEIMLPFVEREKKVIKKKTVPKGSGIVLSKRLLVIENEEISQMLMMKTFIDNDDGYMIDIARDGAQALDLLEKRKYNLVMLKMKLPDMNGYEILDHIRTNPDEKINEIPILVVGGSSMKIEKESTLNAGATEILSKPYTKSELFSSIDRILAS